MSVSPAMFGKSIDHIVTTNFSVDFISDDSGMRLKVRGQQRTLSTTDCF